MAMTDLTHLRTAIANLRRIEREHTRFEGVLGSPNSYHEPLSRAEAEVNAALDALEGAQGVEVKPLEWSKRHSSDLLSRSETIVGTYVVWTHHEANGKWFWRLGDTLNNTKTAPVDTEADGLAAAQADYAARIHALSPAHVPEVSLTTATLSATPTPKEPT